jgi:hypothetical protein
VVAAEETGEIDVDGVGVGDVSTPPSVVSSLGPSASCSGSSMDTEGSVVEESMVGQKRKRQLSMALFTEAWKPPQQKVAERLLCALQLRYAYVCGAHAYACLCSLGLG